MQRSSQVLRPSIAKYKTNKTQTAHTNATIQINQSTNWVKVQQLFSLSNRVPQSNIKQIRLFRRGKYPKRWKLKFCLDIPEHLPYCMEPLSSQMSIPCSSCQALRQPGSLWVILKGRYSEQVVPAAATAFLENSSLPGQLVTNRKTPGWLHQNVLLSSSSSHSLQDRSIRLRGVGQGTAIVFGKSADREDGKLVF